MLVTLNTVCFHYPESRAQAQKLEMKYKKSEGLDSVFATNTIENLKFTVRIAKMTTI